MLRNILKIISVFILGMVGGIFADQIFWPYFVERPLFHQYRLEQPPVYVTEKEEIYIQENEALQQAVEKVEKSVIGVRTETGSGGILKGSGLIVTSDGLLVTLAELVPKGGDFVFFVDGKVPAWQILKRDYERNLALVKIDEKNLSTAGFADLGKLKLGERVFLVGRVPVAGTVPVQIANEGIVRRFDEESIETNIFEGKNLAGSPLFNIEGQALGLNLVDSQGKVAAIPIAQVREFLGF